LPADKLNPIVDVFDEVGVRFAPLDAIDDRPAFDLRTTDKKTFRPHTQRKPGPPTKTPDSQRRTSTPT